MFSKNYFYAVMTLIGAITGAGIFALPFVIAHAGFVTFLVYLPLLVAAQCLIHVLYAKVILSTRDHHRIPGYVEEYGGKRWKKVVSFFCLVGGYGSLLAYIILGGTFLHNLLGRFLGGDLMVYTIVLFAAEALVVLAGLKIFVRAESFLTGVLIMMFGALTIKCLPHWSAGNFTAVNWGEILLPYGPIFFAVSGDAAIPDVCRLLSKEKEKIKSAIIWGTILAAVLMAAFALSVVGAMGGHVTPDSLTGLNQYFGNGVITSALIFGVLCIITSCLVYLQAVREIFWWDFKVNKNLAWFLTVIVPLAVYLLGIKNITSVVGFTGLVSGGLLGVILILLTKTVDKKPQKKSPIDIKTSKILTVVLCSLFVLGFLSELAAMIF